MVKAGYGRIVNIASVAGKEGNPNAAAYAAAKGGLILRVVRVPEPDADDHGARRALHRLRDGADEEREPLTSAPPHNERARRSAHRHNARVP
jgi:hypothetical protein